MIIISHRGNLNGIDKKLENNPKHLLSVLERFQVEIDVWFIEDDWFLGHDSPEYPVKFDFFNDKMWLHCKNLAAVKQLKKSNLNWFWHENDKMALTSKGYIWCLPEVYLENGITVEFNYNKNLPKNIMGICTDFPIKYQNN